MTIAQLNFSEFCRTKIVLQVRVVATGGHQKDGRLQEASYFSHPRSLQMNPISIKNLYYESV